MAITRPYTAQSWETGDVITKEKLNNIEQGLAAIDTEITGARGSGSASGTLGKRIDDLIMVQDTQPTSTDNEIWIRSTGNGVQVPTYEEFEDLVENTVHLDEQTLTSTQKEQARENIDAASVGEVSDLKSAIGKLAVNGQETLYREITWAVGAISNGEIDTSQTTYRYTQDLIPAETAVNTLIDTSKDIEVYVYNSDQSYAGRRSNIPAGSTAYELTNSFLNNKPYVRFVMKQDGLSSFKAYYYVQTLVTKTEFDTTVSGLEPIDQITDSETKSVASSTILTAFESVGEKKTASGNITKILDAIAVKAGVSGRASGESVVNCGINIFDEIFESGYYDQTTGEPKTASRIRSKNPIPVFPGAVLNVVFSDVAAVSILGYSASGVYQNAVLYDKSGNGSFTVPTGVYQLKLYFGTPYGTTYNNDFCLSFSGTNVLDAYVQSIGRRISDSNEITLFSGDSIIYGTAGSALQITYYSNRSGAVGMMPKLKLLSYNIRCLRGGESGAGYDALTTEQITTTLSNFKSLFQKLKPDVFVVCEDRTFFDTTAFATTGGTRSVYTELFEHYFPYRYNQSTGANEPHIYSKYPFVETLRIPVEYGQSATTSKQPPAVKINVEGFDIWVVGLHPAADASAYETDRVPYFNAVVDFAEDKNCVIACGDFNTDTSTPEDELEVFTDAGMELGNMGYFGKFATYRYGTAVYLDNIVTKGMTLNDFTVGDETYSDHFPVSGELNVRL